MKALNTTINPTIWENGNFSGILVYHKVDIYFQGDASISINKDYDVELEVNKMEIEVLHEDREINLTDKAVGVLVRLLSKEMHELHLQESDLSIN